MTLPEKCTVCVVLRDRFSTTERCLDELLKNTPEPYDLIVILGHTPSGMQKKLQEKYGHKARFIFEENFLNQAQYRNIALREAKTPLVAILDNDVYVRPGWLKPLIERLRATNAGFVVPVVLEEPQLIHTAGNDLLITHKGGKAYGQKVLRYAKVAYYENSNLKPSRVDYGELHCQLLQVEPARRLKIFDEKLHEQTEIDSGLLMNKGGYEMWFEPASVVHFDFPKRIRRAEDIRPFKYKWDVPKTASGLVYLRQKWEVDYTEGAAFAHFNAYLNHMLGLWSRLFPCRASMAVDNAYQALRGLAGVPKALLKNLRDRVAGTYTPKN